MKHSKLIYLMTAGILLAGCSSEREERFEGALPISLTCGVTELDTRAATNLNNTNIPAGESVKVLIKKSSEASFSGTTAYTAGGYLYQAAAAGAMTAPDPAPQYPNDGMSVDMMAYYPSDAAAAFEVQADQTTDDSYKASDLMVASPIINQFRTTENVKLWFYHKMAKVIVTATPAAGVSFTITGVKLTNVKRKADFDNSTGSVVLATGSNDPTTIIMSNGGAALFPPQTINTDFIEVTTSEGKSALFSANKKIFEPGHEYTINLKINEEALNVTNTIVDWNADTPISASTDEPHTLGELAEWVNTKTSSEYNNYLGWYVDADGKISKDRTSAIGIIAYMSTTDVDVSVPGSRILVISAADVATSCKWSDNNEASGANTTTNTFDGYSNTAIINKYGNTYAGSKCWAHTPNVDGGSKWFLPSYRQWQVMLQTLGNNDNATLRQKTGMTNNAYWTSTEFPTNTQTAYRLREDGLFYDNSKAYSYDVRACFAYPNKGIALSAVTSANIGWVVTGDGYVYNHTSAAEYAGKTPVAMIAYVGSQNNAAGTGAYSTSLNHGLAISLTNVESGSATMPLATAVSTISSYASEHPLLSSSWLLPTAYQWQRMFEACGGGTFTALSDGMTFSYGKFISYLVDCGGTAINITDSSPYWTSTEYSAANAWQYNFNDTKFCQREKTSNYYVRACFAF